MAARRRCEERSPAVLRSESSQEVKRESLCFLCQASGQRRVIWGREGEIHACIRMEPAARAHTLPPSHPTASAPQSCSGEARQLVRGADGGKGGSRRRGPGRTRRSSLANACPGKPLVDWPVASRSSLHWSISHRLPPLAPLRPLPQNTATPAAWRRLLCEHGGGAGECGAGPCRRHRPWPGQQSAGPPPPNGQHQRQSEAESSRSAMRGPPGEEVRRESLCCLCQASGQRSELGQGGGIHTLPLIQCGKKAGILRRGLGDR
jgi:hypothetical protein